MERNIGISRLKEKTKESVWPIYYLKTQKNNRLFDD